MSASKPVVDRPDSETHWTCPSAPVNAHGDNLTHHMLFPANRCRYCGRSASELRATQALLRAELADGRSGYDQGWEAGYRGTTPPVDPSPEWGRGYAAGFGALLASEKRWEQQS